ncbi:hypothetical protein O3M35_008827 [Rhynocoris fuscipes]|uniref:RlpA-like protein double-psi beta-barrel domain-containing protein n=1 Tax=Rhynocoris fuscipes TaxID=488301 RepID=A0AAW1D7I4_9HEMI
MSVYTLIFVVVIAICLLPESIVGDCWKTGCQLNSWAVKGCAQYGRKETGRSSCNGGFIYTCCENKGASGGNHKPISYNSKHGDMTYYNLGMTACGRTYSNSDHVAALAFGHFTAANPNNDPMCGRRVRIIDPSSKKQVEVTVVDKCQACKMNDIDVSPSVFQQLKPLSAGRTHVKWQFV